jgi:prepilin peptidase dependent protein B
MLKHSVAPSLRAQRQRGLSIVELLVGVAVGLFLVAGAATMFVTNLGNSRQLLVEARINQDMRATTDLIARDLRRAGYWGNALAGTVATVTAGVSATTPNPYRAITPGTGIVEYAFSRDIAENNTRDNNENFGFQRAVVNGVGVVQMQVGMGNWQTVTDPQSMDVTAFNVTPTETTVDVRTACAVACCSDADVTAGTCATRNIAAGASCPTIRVRQYAVALTANAIGNTRVTRTMQTRVRPRNDEYAGVCP